MEIAPESNVKTEHIELKLSGGGIVDRNLAFMDGDIVYVGLIQPPPQPKKKPVKKKLPVEQVKLGAFDTGQKDIEDTKKAKYYLKEMDFKHLECKVMTMQVKEQQELVRIVNKNWS